MTSPDAPADQARVPWVRLALVGAAGGLLSGAFGVGGGILMVPLLILFAGMDQRRASATSLAAIVPAALAGSLTYFANGEIDLLAALFVAIGGIVGSWIGSWLLRRLSLGWLRWLFVGLLIAVAVRMVLVAPVRGDSSIEFDVLPILGMIALGIVIGIASGLFGIGGGVIMVPAFIALFGMSDLVAKGTSLAVMLPTAISGTVANTRAGIVDLRVALVVGIAATIASFGGVAIAFLLSPEWSAWLFAALMVVAAVQLAVRAVRLTRKERDGA
ncbi:sulfite exporter TauE/SafE family protein [Agromyces mariniharenae]|uniref:Probable membrane transporter protein n=1 Tax=Agromyces mariniharenae TaxID=2604423 RepID=A0A5S4V597_9MICO|nr:sulfite exporter TauE/SafE family protein [Agromyces mariniharenae]TYL54094.1 sulfite exporter TauE/SafE family protein [Agromyces mariniharenae]